MDSGSPSGPKDSGQRPFALHDSTSVPTFGVPGLGFGGGGGLGSIVGVEGEFGPIVLVMTSVIGVPVPAPDPVPVAPFPGRGPVSNVYASMSSMYGTYGQVPFSSFSSSSSSSSCSSSCH